VPQDPPEYSSSENTFDKFEREYDDFDDDDEDEVLAEYAKEGRIFEEEGIFLQ